MAAPTRVLFDDFPTTFRGELFRPGDPGYADARTIFNMRLGHWEPGLIARAADVDDVVTVVRYAADAGTPLAVRAGGHGVDGTATPDGALVVDLTNLKEISVDTETGRVRLGAGVLLGEMDPALAAHGLVVPAGTVSTTGVAGLALGGGVGYLMRRYGATVDQMLACDVVTADGRKVRASADENPDLFWALRGGGGNFGVVTHFEFQGQPIPEIVSSGFIPFTIDQAPKVLAGLRSYMTTAPRELGVIGALTQCPPLPPVPAELHGEPCLMLIVVYSGPQEKADAVIADMAALGDPASIAVAPTPWPIANKMLDVIAPSGRRSYTKGAYLAELTDEHIAIGVKYAKLAPPRTNPPMPSSVQNFWVFGGAISEDFEESSTAFSRDAEWFWEVAIQCDVAADDERFMTWADNLHAELKPTVLSNVYINLSTDMGPEWRRGAWGAEGKYEKLVDAKTKWDPTNMFRFNKNIEPRT
ncbi:MULTISPECIES: FAD-binding oxidoreductase [unclassified Mycobacterium]|uniref:FAD-binding oxidoreductase n=1 Tax=unclassified Mycobacterium TaxID=2642494 RepID=UPI0029C7FFCF|nr:MULTISPECIES: FAD-binding protein [unclassified Mycobacterium]